MDMELTLFVQKGKKEVINRVELSDVAASIQHEIARVHVRRLREKYHLMNPKRQPDGRRTTNFADGIGLPRICFSALFKHNKGELNMLKYNGLVVVEVNDLPNYDIAVTVREQAKRMPETMMCFLGASGKSVKIVVRGELYGSGGLPKEENEIRQFQQNIYNTARSAYQNQFGFSIAYMEPRLDRTIYMTDDPKMFYNPDARAFLADTEEHKSVEPINITPQEKYLMPGRTITRTYHLNWLFIVNSVLNNYFELPDEDRQTRLLMIIAGKCLEEGIPLAHAQGLTLLHPALNTDKLLVEKVFQAVYSVAEQEDYYEKHKTKPLRSVPKETLQVMQTEIFLNSHYAMRKNLLTGVAEYKEKFSEDQEFKPLTEEVRNDMTLKAMELGVKSWDRDVNRYIDSTRIEQYDPVNTWLDKLPQWDGHDYIADLAKRVPTNQPHWEKYLKFWLTGMVAQWRERDKQLTGNALTPLLIGRQGCGKTRFCKILLPTELRDYYNDKINFKNEFDLNIALTSFALINIDEFDKTTNSQQIVLKYLLSSADVKFRPPYGKTIKQYRRYTSFIGTTNQQKPLVDPTGSRRFVCVGVTGNIDFTDNLNHQQLFAQALNLFNQGERFWLDDNEIKQLIKENEPYQHINELVEMIGETFRNPEEGEQGRWWSIAEISNMLSSKYASFDSETSFKKIGNALNDVQFNFKNRRTSNHMEYWLVLKE